MIFEIRNYHYEPSLMSEYKKWAVDVALPYIRDHLNLVGFWVNLDEAPLVNGAPQDKLGSATVTWILEWPDMATRNDAMSKVFATPEWQEIMSSNPGQENYLRTEAKFAEAL